MKLNLIALLFLVLTTACSQQEQAKTQTNSASATPAPTVENAKAVLDASKQVEQTTLNAAEQQKATLEKTEQ